MKSERPTGRSGIGGWVFLVVVLVIYAATALVDSGPILEAVSVFTRLLDKVLPALALVFVLIFAIDLLLDPKRVEKYLGRRSGILGWLAAIVAGILSTGPVYARYVVLHDLRQKGMKTLLVAAMLYSRAVKLPLTTAIGTLLRPRLCNGTCSLFDRLFNHRWAFHGEDWRHACCA